MSRRVFACRNNPNQNAYSAPVTPPSRVVGTLGNAAERFAPFTASAVSLPWRPAEPPIQKYGWIRSRSGRRTGELRRREEAIKVIYENVSPAVASFGS